jgi:hypothetical protein
MPPPTPPRILNDIIREAMVLHEEGHKNIRFEFAG